MGEQSTFDVGVDIGLRRLAIAWPYWGIASSFDMGKSSGRSRDWELRAMQKWLRTQAEDGPQLWIDQAFAQASVAVAQRLTETIAAVMTAREWHRPPIVVHSMTWKSQVIGNHRADKDEIKAYLQEHHPKLAEKCHTEDEHDAMVIGLYGKGRSEGVILAPVPKKKSVRRSKKS